jgi:peptide/nickel transport system permease protein
MVVWVIATLVFVLLRVTSDPASSLVTFGATQEQLQAVRVRLGLDKPLPVQYAGYIASIVTNRMPPSYRYTQPAMELVLERVPATFELAAAGAIIALLVAVPIGIVSAARRNTVVDYIASFFSFLGYATPTFWLGTMLVLVFAVQLKVLPTSGNASPRHLILPALTLALFPMGQLTRLVRSETLNVLSEDYVRTARAKGIAEHRVIVSHTFRNALLPVVTLSGILLGNLLAGAIVTETIFGWPGLGRLALEATLNRDFPLIEASVVFIAFIVGTINLAVDVAYAVIDPRIRYR